MNLTVSDIINIISIITTFTVSIIALYISHQSNKQSSKMIDLSIKPNVCLSIIPTTEGKLYLRAKNFGSSNAIIKCFIVNFEIGEQHDAFPIFPLIKIKDCILAPQQFIASELDRNFLNNNHYVTVLYKDEIGNEYSNTTNLISSYSNAFYSSDDYEYLK